MSKEFIDTTMIVASKGEESEVDRLMNRETRPEIVGNCPIRIELINVVAYHPIPSQDGSFSNELTTVYMAGGMVFTINENYKRFDEQYRIVKLR